ncbi:MAG TPA: MarR family transcriptional regulator [Candidatus Krumholzibacteria bacterium]
MDRPGHSHPRTPRARDPKPDLSPLLRSTHIFAATVHNVLQLEPIHRVGTHAITPAQCNLLRIASMKGHHPVGQVASLLGISGPAATKTIDKLESLGLVERCPCEGDRRTHLFRVTAAGKELVRRCEKMKKERLQAAMERFDPEEIRQFEEFLRRFSVSLLYGNHDSSGPCLLCEAHLLKDCPVARVRGGCPHEELLRGRSKRKRAAGPAKAGIAC